MLRATEPSRATPAVAERVYTQLDVDNARTKGQLLGWLQGAGALVLFAMVVKLAGWIPLLGIGLGAAWLGYRFLSRGKPAKP
jgi:hypothetical protein